MLSHAVLSGIGFCLGTVLYHWGKSRYMRTPCDWLDTIGRGVFVGVFSALALYLLGW